MSDFSTPSTPVEEAIVSRVLRFVRSEDGGALTLHAKRGRGPEAVTWERLESGRFDSETAETA